MDELRSAIDSARIAEKEDARLSGEVLALGATRVDRIWREFPALRGLLLALEGYARGELEDVIALDAKRQNLKWR